MHRSHSTPTPSTSSGEEQKVRLHLIIEPGGDSYPEVLGWGETHVQAVARSRDLVTRLGLEVCFATLLHQELVVERTLLRTLAGFQDMDYLAWLCIV